MRIFSELVAVAAVAGVLAFNAHALTITPATLAAATGNQTSQAEINAAIAPIIGSASLLYKQNVGGLEEGSLAGSYTTTFSNTPADPSDALISYVDGQGYVGAPAWLLVKDGDQKPAWYLFNLTGLWNGTDDLVLQDFWPGNGAISHVSL